MRWWKQVAIAAVLVVLAGFLLVRLAPQAAARLGVPASVVAALGGSPAGPGQRGPGRRPGFGADRETLVVTAPVGTARINDRLSAIGDGEALRSVTIVPLTSGQITRMRFAAGDHVEAGDVLAELDAEAEQIKRDRAALAEELAKRKLDRFEKLVASLAASEVQLNEARNEYDNARLELRDAQLQLSRRSIIAPIGGTVGLVPVEVGDYVTTQTEIATIDDRSEILVDFWVPERFAANIATGQSVEAVAIAMPGDVFTGTVSQIASRVDRESRTLQVRARLDNPHDRLRPGMSFRVTMRFPGDEFAAVDPLAIQWSSQGAFVWKDDEGRAARVPVRIVQRNSDTVLVDADLEVGQSLVIEGVQTLRDGVKLRIAGEPANAPPAAGS